MVNQEIIKMGILDTLDKIKNQTLTAEQVTKAYLEQIEKTKHKNAIL